MADTSTIEDSADLEHLDVGQTAKRQPSGSNQEQFSTEGDAIMVGGRFREIYEISVDGGPRKKTGWRIHEGSKVNIYGAYLGIYRQITLIVNGSPYDHKNLYPQEASDGRTTISFVVSSDIKGLYSNASLVYLKFVDADNPNNTRFLKENFRYYAETEEEKEKRGKASDNAVGEEGSGRNLQQSTVVADASTVRQGLSGAVSSEESAIGSRSGIISSSSATVGSLGGSINQSAEVDFDDDASLETSAQETSVSSTTEISGGTQTTSSGSSTSQTQTTEVSSGGAVQANQSTNISATVEAGGGAVAAGGDISTTISASGAVSAASSGGSADAEVQSSTAINAAASATFEGQADPAVETPAGISGPREGQANVGGQVNITGSPSGEGRPSSAQVGGVSGGAASLSAGTARIGSSTISPRGIVGGPSIKDNTPGASQNQKPPAGSLEQADGKPVSEGSNQEPNLSGQPLIEPLVGKGKVDGIENQEPGQGSDGQAADSEIPLAQKTPAEKIPSPNEGIDGAKPAMPAGMKGMEDNKNLLGNKLNLPQSPGQALGKPVPGVGSEPSANPQQLSKASNFPDAAAKEDQPSASAPLGKQSAGAGPLNESQQPSDQGPAGPNPPAGSEPGQKDEQKPGQNAEVAGQEKDQEEDQDTESGLPGQKAAPSNAVKQEELDEKTKEAIKLANQAMNDELMVIAVNLWWLSIPTFGVGFLVGAVLGDFLWAFKSYLIKKFLTPFLTTDELKNKAEEIAEEIKFSGLVKFNIILMNLAVLVLFLLALLFLVSILKGLCDNWVTGAAAYVAGLGDVCKAVG